MTPTSLPSDARIFDPMILLLWMYSVPPSDVEVVVVDWVCACAGAMARPTAAKAAPKIIVFFICVKTDGKRRCLIQRCSFTFGAARAVACVRRSNERGFPPVKSGILRWGAFWQLQDAWTRGETHVIPVRPRQRGARFFMAPGLLQ